MNFPEEEISYTILAGEGGGHRINNKIDGKEYLIMKEDEILLIVK